jgi:hypothetical protein
MNMGSGIYITDFFLKVIKSLCHNVQKEMELSQKTMTDFAILQTLNLSSRKTYKTICCMNDMIWKSSSVVYLQAMNTISKLLKAVIVW